MNHGWRDLPIRAQVTEAVRIPTVVGHDVRAGLVAEARLGAAVGARDALFLPLGTGIAAALMVDGHVLSGGGWAGELGHVSVDPDGPPCACGGTGCLEVIASASASGTRVCLSHGRSRRRQDCRAARGGGRPGRGRRVERAVSALARAIVTTITLTGIDLVVVGGGLAQSGDTLLAPLRAEIEALRTFQRPPRIVTPEPGGLGRLSRGRLPGLGRLMILTVTLNPALDSVVRRRRPGAARQSPGPLRRRTGRWERRERCLGAPRRGDPVHRPRAGRRGERQGRSPRTWRRGASPTTSSWEPASPGER